MAAFALSQPLSSFCGSNSIISNPTLKRSKAPSLRSKRYISVCRASSFSKLTRRAAISLFVTSAIAPVVKHAHAEGLIVEPYDANKSRRYVDEGRPSPDRPVPKFASDVPYFKIDDQLSAQDVNAGSGASIQKGTLVMARWLAVLADGTTVDDANESQPALFRPGAHQVPPGIEDAVLGMREGGMRRILGSSQRILSNIALGNNIGERSLVPTGSMMYVDIFVDRVNPFGKGP